MTWQFGIYNLLPGSFLIFSPPCVAALTRHWSLDSYGGVVITKHTDVWIITPSSNLSLFTEVLFNWVLLSGIKAWLLFSFWAWLPSHRTLVSKKINMAAESGVACRSCTIITYFGFIQRHFWTKNDRITGLVVTSLVIITKFWRRTLQIR